MSNIVTTENIVKKIMTACHGSVWLNAVLYYCISRSRPEIPGFSSTDLRSMQKLTAPYFVALR